MTCKSPRLCVTARDKNRCYTVERLAGKKVIEIYTLCMFYTVKAVILARSAGGRLHCQHCHRNPVKSKLAPFLLLDARF